MFNIAQKKKIKMLPTKIQHLMNKFANRTKQLLCAVCVCIINIAVCRKITVIIVHRHVFDKIVKVV